MTEMEVPPVAPTPTPDSQPEILPVPWTVRDTWLGVVLLALTLAGLLFVVKFAPKTDLVQNIVLIATEIALLLPVGIIFAWKRISWQALALGKFPSAAMTLGCGALVGVYPLILLHNAILYLLGIDTQGTVITQVLHRLDSPWTFVFSAVILAPLAEEILFRGFLFAGFRQRYGWLPALLISSAIFGASHLQLVAFIPTFLLGCVLAYVYHRSNSLWPGVILHFLVNGTALTITLLVLKFGSSYITHG